MDRRELEKLQRHGRNCVGACLVAAGTAIKLETRIAREAIEENRLHGAAEKMSVLADILLDWRRRAQYYIDTFINVEEELDGSVG